MTHSPHTPAPCTHPSDRSAAQVMAATAATRSGAGTLSSRAQPWEIHYRRAWQRRAPRTYQGTVWAVSAYAAAYQWRKAHAVPAGHVIAVTPGLSLF